MPISGGKSDSLLWEIHDELLIGLREELREGFSSAEDLTEESFDEDACRFFSNDKLQSCKEYVASFKDESIIKALPRFDADRFNDISLLHSSMWSIYLFFKNAPWLGEDKIYFLLHVYREMNRAVEQHLRKVIRDRGTNLFIDQWVPGWIAYLEALSQAVLFQEDSGFKRVAKSVLVAGIEKIRGISFSKEQEEAGERAAVLKALYEEYVRVTAVNSIAASTVTEAPLPPEEGDGDIFEDALSYVDGAEILKAFSDELEGCCFVLNDELDNENVATQYIDDVISIFMKLNEKLTDFIEVAPLKDRATAEELKNWIGIFTEQLPDDCTATEIAKRMHSIILELAPLINSVGSSTLSSMPLNSDDATANTVSTDSVSSILSMPIHVRNDAAFRSHDSSIAGLIKKMVHFISNLCRALAKSYTQSATVGMWSRGSPAFFSVHTDERISMKHALNERHPIR